MASFKNLKWFLSSVVAIMLLMPDNSSALAKEECKAKGKSENCRGSPDSDEEKWNFSSCQLLKYGAGAAAGIAAAPALLAAMGFTAGGVAAGSLAAKLFAATAAANGGAVPAASLVAFLQSVGVTGFGLTAKGIIGGFTGYLASLIPGCEDFDVHIINAQEASAADMDDLSIDDLCKIWDLIKEYQKAAQNEGNDATAPGFGHSPLRFEGKRDGATGGQGDTSKFQNLKPDEIDLLCTLWKTFKGQL